MNTRVAKADYNYRDDQDYKVNEISPDVNLCVLPM